MSSVVPFPHAKAGVTPLDFQREENCLQYILSHEIALPIPLGIIHGNNRPLCGNWISLGKNNLIGFHSLLAQCRTQIK